MTNKFPLLLSIKFYILNQSLFENIVMPHHTRKHVIIRFDPNKFPLLLSIKPQQHYCTNNRGFHGPRKKRNHHWYHPTKLHYPTEIIIGSLLKSCFPCDSVMLTRFLMSSPFVSISTEISM
jgi:hypothetical protein